MHDWMEDAQVMLDHVLEVLKSARQLASPTKVILVGSSMGAWIALNLALVDRNADLISGVIGIGSAIDITHTTFQQLTPEQQSILLSPAEEGGNGNPFISISSPYMEEPYPFSRALYDSGKQYLLCHNHPDTVSQCKNNLSCPVRFLHGVEDDVVPWSEVVNAADILRSNGYHGEDVTVQLLDGGDHRLSRPEDISVLLETLDDPSVTI
jgi:pimeloyl-ACP methyl ester carboxylesterase